MKRFNFSLMLFFSMLVLFSLTNMLDSPALAHPSLDPRLPSRPETIRDPLTNSMTITFTDGNFSSGWTQVSVATDDPRAPGPGPGTSSGNSVHQTSGGNPDAFRRSTNNIVYGDNIFTGGLNLSAVYTPSVSGAITTVDFAIDLLEDPTRPGVSAWQLLLEQGGVFYYLVPLQTFDNSTWQPFSRSGLTAISFDTNPNVGVPGAIPDNQQPDFTTNGAPITFGYVLGNGLSAPGTLTLNHSVDNWSVTVHVSDDETQTLYLPLVWKRD